MVQHNHCNVYEVKLLKFPLNKYFRSLHFFQRLLQSISEHKPLIDKLNKTGEALIKLVQYEEGQKVQEILDSDNQRYDSLRNLLKARQEALEKALQESSEFSDKLEGMLRALTNAADEMSSAEPVSRLKIA